MDEIKFEANGETYVVENNAGAYQYFKIQDGQKIVPENQELRDLLQVIKDINSKHYSEEKTLNNELDTEMKLVRTKKENEGFTSTMMIFIVTEVVSLLFIAFQLFFIHN